MTDIFISYSSHDRDSAMALCEHLRSSGYTVWIDKSGIDVATSWSNEIAQALDNCSAFILLLSQNSLLSKNVIKELSLDALSRGEFLIKFIELENLLLKLSHDLEIDLDTVVRRDNFMSVDEIIYALYQ